MSDIPDDVFDTMAGSGLADAPTTDPMEILLMEALRRCRTEDGSPVRLIHENDLYYVTLTVADALRDAGHRAAPTGWWPFGTFAGVGDVPFLEFSEQVDKGGAALWERPAGRSVVTGLLMNRLRVVLEES